MTTNHPEKLDPALIRPGRVDVKEYLGYASPYQMRQMFLRFYGGLEENAATFAQILSDYNKPLSTAYLQGLFVSNKEDPGSALREAKRHLETKSEERDLTRG